MVLTYIVLVDLLGEISLLHAVLVDPDGILSALSVEFAVAERELALPFA